MGFFLFHEFNFTHGNQNTNLISKYRFPIFVLQRAHRKTTGRAISCVQLKPSGAMSVMFTSNEKN